VISTLNIPKLAKSTQIRSGQWEATRSPSSSSFKFTRQSRSIEESTEIISSAIHPKKSDLLDLGERSRRRSIGTYVWMFSATRQCPIPSVIIGVPFPAFALSV
jgi:hypothetical protein